MKENAGLTQRESQIAELLAWGGARKEVADRLHISIRTIETTTQNIYRKIGIQKAPELTVWWFITRLKVPISMDPWKRTMVAVFFLITILPQELGLYQTDIFRGSRTRTEIVTRANRSKKE